MDNWYSPPDWFPDKRFSGVLPVPNALGWSSRVFRANCSGFNRDPAIKLMRRNKVDYAGPLFEREVKVLTILDHKKGITNLMNMGFMHLSNGSVYPIQEKHERIAPIDGKSAKQCCADYLTGDAILFDLDEADQFLTEMYQRINEDWMPFLVLEQRWDQNLYLMADQGRTKGKNRKYFPVELALEIAIQICDILQLAHDHQMTYMDHKILHYYWNPILKRVSAIDWNIGDGPSDEINGEYIRVDLINFAANALHHLLTGRPSQGATNLGATQRDEIYKDHKYSVEWRDSDSERISDEEKSFLEESINGGFKNAEEMKASLEELLLERQN